MGVAVTSIPPSRNPMPACAKEVRKMGPAFNPIMATKAARPSAVIRLIAPSGMRPNNGISGSQMPHGQPREQCTDTRAERNAHAPDWHREQYADEPAEEDRESERDKVRLCRRRNHGTDPHCNAIYHSSGADQMQDITSLQHNAGRDRDALTTAREVT